MIVRKLTCEEDRENGGEGWMPQWLKNHNGIEPSYGFGISHDILEHIVDKIGGAEGELMAFGASLWVRGEAGKEMRLQYDFARMLEAIIVNGNQTLKCPGRTYKLRDYDYWDAEMGRIVSNGIDIFESDCEIYLDTGDFHLTVSEIKRRAISWMRKGFRKAQEYYRRHGLDSFSVAYLFDKITKIVEHESKGMELGEVLTIRIDFKACEVTGSKDYPY